MRILKN